MISPKSRAVLEALTPADREELRRILAARAADRAHYLSPNAAFAAWLAKSPSPRKPSPLCADCAWLRADGDGPCATHRRACEGCGRGPDDVALHDGEVSTSKLGPGEAPIVERWCATCDPPGLRYADSQPDPWDLASEELVTTCDLPREAPAYWGRDRSEQDLNDDKSDIQPFGRTTK